MEQQVQAPEIKPHNTSPYSFDTPPTSWSLGRLIPLTLFAWLLLDLIPRFLPVDWLNIYPHQIAAMHPQRFAPFQPNLQLSVQNQPGELALMANIPATETTSPLRFSTDALGFRDTPPSKNQRPRILTVEGDSFTFGAALDDEDTLSAVLTRNLGVPAYNAGRVYTDPERLRELDWLLTKVNVARPATVIYVMLDRFELSMALKHDQTLMDHIARKMIGDEVFTKVKEELRFHNRQYQLWWPISPLRIQLVRFYKSLCNDKFLPNEYKHNVNAVYTRDGSRWLIEPRILERFVHPPDRNTTRETARYLGWLRDEMRRRNLDFWVLLVPEWITVYSPWLEEGSPKPSNPDLPYLDRLECELHGLGVKTVNGLTVMRSTAARDLAGHELYYHREDHHWTSKGVRILAGAMAEALRSEFQVQHTRRAAISGK